MGREALGVLEGRERYELVRLIAEGGMGTVYKARKIGVAGFEKTVAIKMLRKQLSDNESYVESFISEAKLVANLIHENIVQIYQLERYAGAYYFVIEYVDGMALFDLVDFHVKLRRQMPLELAVFIAARVARGLAYAHSRRGADGRPLGIVHCDVCPHNILINTEGVPKITDFGIARVASQKAAEGRVSGKLAFMAPEQARLEPVDFRADIYALGIVLFYMISGRMARNVGLQPTEQLAQARENRIDWSLLPENLPEEIIAMLHKMLAGDPSDRYDDTSVLARDLEYYIYKDGYGPTIVTLADYMKTLMPGRFGLEPDAETDAIGDDDRTIVLNQKTIKKEMKS
ncbi:serine/threonine-protein kinase [uncultured Victivallis sp.]|uniref:serine/threonine protein kinase n=1 Tax=uncultured Victivallis sp. TaxID=354118 RepID=UPI0025D7BB91|nr:serine/threonine-protein kinase [uncultured Victivallis sp.]